MTATYADVTSYRSIAEQLPSEAFLGQIVMYTVREVDVHLDTLQTLVNQRGLTKGDLRPKIFPADAFKRACAELATTFNKRADTKAALLVRPAGQDEEFIYRNLVLERARYTGEKRSSLKYYTLATLAFRRTDEVVVTEYPDAVPGGLTPEESAWVNTYLGVDGKHLKERHRHWKAHIDSDGVRSYIRSYLLALDGFAMKKNGGVYFIPQEHAPELRLLAQVIGEVGSSMHLVPLLDIGGQRELLAETFTDDAMLAADSFMREVQKILADPSQSVSRKVYDGYVARAGEMLGRTKKYSHLLDEKLVGAHARVQLLVGQLADLSDKLED
jgi:hypothetical protein